MSVYTNLIEQGRERASRVVPNPYRLTPQEKEIAAWLGNGLCCRQIADKLSIGQHIVATHITRLAAKLGARNATHLNLIIHTLPGLPIAQPTLVVIEDFREAFGMGWISPEQTAGAALADG